MDITVINRKLCSLFRGNRLIGKQAGAILVVFVSLSTYQAGVSISNPFRQGTIPSGASGASNDVTSVVEEIGNPFLDRYPENDLAYVRNVWDMQVYGDRLYMGYGNSNNAGPGSNAGPIEAWYWDGNRFAYDTILQQEQIDRFVLIDGLLAVPSHDPRGTASATIHLFDGSQWTQSGDVSGAAHIYDVIRYNGLLYAALGISGRSGAVIGISSDDGQSWTRQILPVVERAKVFSKILRAWQFFKVGDDLFVSVLPQYSNVKLNGVWGYERLSSPVFHLDRKTLEFEQSPIDFFAGQVADTVDGRAGRVVRPLSFSNLTVYSGARTLTDHNWTPFGLFSIDTDDNVHAYPLPSGVQPWDTLAFQNALYVLTAQPLSGGGTTVSVIATCDFAHWREVLHFQAPTFARSFELYRGDFYFGLGTEVSPNAPQAGTILRVDHANFDLNCS